MTAQVIERPDVVVIEDKNRAGIARGIIETIHTPGPLPVENSKIRQMSQTLGFSTGRRL
ncbi:MAG: hypothetical protein P4L33_19090 [Capsulimonadaceae bacterium]|nr:hypothetical protein [Capsulimonadaceae bacterium]